MSGRNAVSSQDNILWDAFSPPIPEILEARKALRRKIGEAGSLLWGNLYEAMRVDGPYRPDADAIGRRSLAITALGYLAKVRSIDDVLRGIDSTRIKPDRALRCLPHRQE